VPLPELGEGGRRSGGDLQRRAWQSALANRASDGSLPSGSAIARAHCRKERWGRLVKNVGQVGVFGTSSDPESQSILGSPADQPSLLAPEAAL